MGGVAKVIGEREVLVDLDCLGSVIDLLIL